MSFSLSNISFGRVKEMSQGDISLTHPKHMLLKLLKQIMNRSFSLNPVCLKFISKKRVFRKITVRDFPGLTVIRASSCDFGTYHTCAKVSYKCLWCRIQQKKSSKCSSLPLSQAFSYRCVPKKKPNNFLISQPNHMLWVLKRTVSMRPFF